MASKLYYSAVAKMMDVTVAFSFGSWGYHIRRHLWDDPENHVDMSGKTVVITGANAGLGMAMATALAARQARVVLLCRNLERGQKAADEIYQKTNNHQVSVKQLDVSILGQVRKVGKELVQEYGVIDVLINNAGVLPVERSDTSEGFESAFATNVLGGFVLIDELLPAILRAPQGRIVEVSSGGMYLQKLNLKVLQGNTDNYDGVVAYAQTKRAQIILTEKWADLLKNTPVTVNCMHPGWAATPGVSSSLPRFYRWTKAILRTPEQGADTAVWLASSPALASVSGRFFFDRTERNPEVLPTIHHTEAERAALWELCSTLSQTNPARHLPALPTV